MIPSRVIEQKRDGGAIDGKALAAFLAAYLEGSVPDYQMAAFLGVFAFTMAIQFASYLLEAVADFRQEPGKRQPNTPAAN